MIYYINESSEQDNDLRTIDGIFYSSISKIEKKYDKRFRNNIRHYSSSKIQDNIIGYYELDRVKDLKANDYHEILDMCNEIADDCTYRISYMNSDYYDELDCYRSGNRIIFKIR